MNNKVEKFRSVLKTLALDYLQQYYQSYSQSLFQQTLEVQDWDYLYPKILLKPMAAKYRHKIMTMEKVLRFHLLFQKHLPHRFVILNSISKEVMIFYRINLRKVSVFIAMSHN